MATPDIRVIRPGETQKRYPFTICIIANPVLLSAGGYRADAIMGKRSAFDACVAYIDACLFGNLPHQAEKLLAPQDITPKVREVSLYVPGLPVADPNALVSESYDLIEPRRTLFAPFMRRYGLEADVAFAVSLASNDRASAYHTSDDDSRPGTPFLLDGVSYSHRHFNHIPGTVAIHATTHSLVALHEFSHALASYTNGKILDLYVDSQEGVNVKRGRPIPKRFADYNGTILASDPDRDTLGYPAGWASYHCELHAPSYPAVMDNFWQASVPERCEHDTITRRFLQDRVRAKMSR
jgi:hypothetical protein